MGSNVSPFQPYQIVYIECQQARLYTEVIQVIPERQTCWVRPLGLITTEPETNIETSSTASPFYQRSLYEKIADQKVVHDLRQASDLLMPIHLFQAALDVEVLPLLAQTPRSDIGSEIEATAQSRLNDFVRQLWEIYFPTFQAHPSAPSF